MKFSHLALGLFALAIGACKSQEKTATCKSWHYQADKANLQLGCSAQNGAVTIKQPYFLLASGQLPDAQYPYLDKHCLYVNRNTVVRDMHEADYTGLLIFLRGKRDTVAELTVSKGIIQTAWLRDSSGMVYTETWNTTQQVEPIDPPVLRKPILYLYNTDNQEISIKLPEEKLLHSYPAYPENTGWRVQAQSDGSLLELGSAKRFYALYWESEEPNFGEYDLSQGFVVAGQETASFLENKLEEIGLNWRERNEFIMYWLPVLEGNAYNFLHFSTQEYAHKHPLILEPQAESILRFSMFYRPLTKFEAYPAQTFPRFERRGFTAVEWGGGRLPEGDL